MEDKTRATVPSKKKTCKLLFDEKDEIKFPALNHILIPEDEVTLTAQKKEDFGQNKNTPYFSTLSRLMYAAGDLSLPDPDCVLSMVSFMKNM